MLSQIIAEAVHRTVIDNGGPTVLGPRLGLRPAVLSNKANPRQHHNRLTLDESMRLQQRTGDHRILYAEAQELGYVVVPIEHNPPPCDVELLTLHARWNSDIGQVNGAIADAFEDAVITSNEAAEIRQRLFVATRTGFAYLNRMGGLAQ